MSLQNVNGNNAPGVSPAFCSLVAAQGATGSTGIAGATGPRGSTGAAGAGVRFAGIILNPASASSFFFAPNASGDATVGGNWVTFNQTSVSMPASCTFDSLFVNASAIPAGLGLGGAITVTMYKNGSATALSASGNSAIPSGGSLTGASVAVVSGDNIALQASGAGVSTGQGTIRVSMHCQ